MLRNWFIGVAVLLALGGYVYAETIAKRHVVLEISWKKEAPDYFFYRVRTFGYVTDGTKAGGEERLDGWSETSSITRTAFRALTGAQIEATATALADSALTDLGTGGHTIQDDDGN